MRKYLRGMGTKKENIITTFCGINTNFEKDSIPAEFATDMKNISALSYPNLKTREGREKFASADGEILYMGTIEGKYISCVVKKGGVCTWKYYDGEWKDISVVEESPTGRYDMIYFINATVLSCGKAVEKDGIKKGKSYALNFENGNAVCTVEEDMPRSDMLDTINGRMAAAYSGGAKVFLGGSLDRNVWFEIDDGLEQNVVTQDCENISAIKTFGGHLLCMKEHSFGEIYGNTPDTYTMIMVSESMGCIAPKTICDCGRLVWLSDEGVVSYGGGSLPKNVSSPIRKYLENMDRENASNACAGYDGKRYILSLPQNGGEWVNLVMNTENGQWFVEDEKKFTAFCNVGDTLYGATAQGDIFILFSNCDEEFEWKWQSKVFGSGMYRKKGLRRIYIEAESEGEIKVSITGNEGEAGGAENIVKEDTFTKKNRFYVDLHPAFLGRCNTFKITISGRGACRIISVGMLLRDKNISYI